MKRHITKTDRHKSPLTGIRFPPEVKAELKRVAEEYRLKMNDIVVKATEEKLDQIKKKEKIL